MGCRHAVAFVSCTILSFSYGLAVEEIRKIFGCQEVGKARRYVCTDDIACFPEFGSQLESLIIHRSRNVKDGLIDYYRQGG
ncbi:hypothetical protein BDQ17DRAFT_1357450, partial [Cyathus striatus]